MLPNRSDRSSSHPLVATEILQPSAGKPPADDSKEENQIPLFWRIFGGTVLSASVFVGLNAFQHLSSALAGVRGDLGQLRSELSKEMNRFSEVQSELVSREELDSRLRSISRDIKDLQEERKSLDQLRKRASELSEQFSQVQQQRRELADQIHQCRVLRVAQYRRQTLTSELAVLRERLAAMETPTVLPMPRD